MKRIRALVAEDELLIQLHLIGVLKEHGCEIIGTVETGEEAVEAALRERPDVVFMDIKLQGRMDGYEAARRIAAESAIPIVFISAYDPGKMGNPGDVTNSIAVVNKPIDLDELREVLDTLLRQV